MEKISEAELVQRYGTEAQIKKYESDGELKGYDKARILKRAAQYCTVFPMGNGEYKLTNFKKVPLTPEYIKTTKGLYKYTCPLILDYVLSNRKEGKVVLGKISLAQNIEMVSQYYCQMNYDLYATSDVLDLKLSVVYDYFNHVTESVNRYIMQTLEYLQKMNLIVFKKNYVFYWSNATPNGEGFSVANKTTIATDETMQIYTDALRYADEMTGAKTTRDRYFSGKSSKWSNYFHEKLGANGIMNVFPVYEIYIVNADKCKLYRSEFASSARLMSGLGKELRENVYKNAEARSVKLEDDCDVVDYLMACEFLSKICIGNPNLGKRLKLKMNEISKMSRDHKYRITEMEEYNEV